MSERRIQAVELRGHSGLGVYLRVGDEPRLYRLAPVRDPNQPRFWCLAAFECTSCGTPVSGSALWAGCWGSSQGDLSGLLATIKTDAERWLQEKEGNGLSKLLLQPRPPLTLPLARVPRAEPDASGDGDLAGTTERAS